MSSPSAAVLRMIPAIGRPSKMTSAIDGLKFPRSIPSDKLALAGCPGQSEASAALSWPAQRPD
jgi:hypothetical protein